MDFTYDRKVSHCSKSKYIKTVTVKEIEPVANADALDIARFNEAGWQVVVKKGSVAVGDKLFFMPPETVLPRELSEALGVTKYLQKGKVKVVRMRGVFSEGLIADKQTCIPYLDGILQWEDEPTQAMHGDAMPAREIPVDEFPVFYKIPNLLNEPEIFSPGDEVFVTEKIHGTNCRFGMLKNPATGRYQLYVGSHNVVLKNPDWKPSRWERFKAWLSGKKIPRPRPNVYWTTVTKILEGKTLPHGVVFYGEIYGAGVQDLDYGVPAKDLKLRVFATYERGQYNTAIRTGSICTLVGLDTVPRHGYTFLSVDNAIALSQEPSEFTKKHIREGVVIQSVLNPMKWAKVVSPEYLARRGKATERH